MNNSGLQLFRMFARVLVVVVGRPVGMLASSRSRLSLPLVSERIRISCLREDLRIAERISTQSSHHRVPNLHRHCFYQHHRHPRHRHCNPSCCNQLWSDNTTPHFSSLYTSTPSTPFSSTYTLQCPSRHCKLCRTRLSPSHVSSKQSELAAGRADHCFTHYYYIEVLLQNNIKVASRLLMLKFVGLFWKKI